MKITDTVTDCTTNDLHATTPETSTQTAYDGTTPIKFELVKHGLIKPKNDDQKQSKITKEACTALGLPIDTKGGKKSPEQNVAILKWLIAKYAKQSESTDLPIVEPVAPAEEVAEAIEPAEVLPVPEVTTNADLFALETVTPSNQIIINTDLITEINNQISLAESNADKALEFQDRAIAHSQNAGVLLLQVKATLRHGEFGGWLLENINVSERQAQRYMRSAKGLPVLRTITKTDTVSDLKNDADLVAQVETLETEALRLENEKLQHELLKAQQAAEDLRNNQTQIIDAKVSAVISTERAALIVESSAATQTLEKQLSDAKDKIARDKKDLDKAITDGVRCKMNELDNEIRRKELSPEGLTESIKELRETKSELNEEVGAIQKHNKSVEKIKDYLTSVKGYTWDLLDDSASTPVENLNDWYLIDDALDKLKQDVADIISNGKTLREVIKSQPIDGEVVTGELVI